MLSRDVDHLHYLPACLFATEPESIVVLKRCRPVFVVVSGMIPNNRQVETHVLPLPVCSERDYKESRSTARHVKDWNIVRSHQRQENLILDPVPRG